MSNRHPAASRTSARTTTLVAWIALAAATASGCARAPDESPTAPSPAAPSPRVLATFIGHVDTAAGTLTFETPSSGQVAQALTSLTINSTTTPAANTVELLTTADHWDPDGTGACGMANEFCADVTVRSRFAVDLADVYVQLDTLEPAGTAPYNADPAVLGTDATLGLWGYGQIAMYDSMIPATAPSRTWRFMVPSATRFTFTGRVLADVTTTPGAPRALAPLSTSTVTSQSPTLSWVNGTGGDGARVEVCQDRAFQRLVTAFDTTGTRHAPPAALPAGHYFWRLRGLDSATMAVGAATSPVWEFTVGARSAPVDTSWGTSLDVNGDGYADVVVGAPDANMGTGAAYIYLGSAMGVQIPMPLPASARLVAPAGANNGEFGCSVASAGDVNGDGYADIIVGAQNASGSAGRAYVYLVTAMGIATPTTLSITGRNSFFGTSVASAGDVNGDGYADVIVGAYGVGGSTGNALVYLGSSAGIATTPTTVLAGTRNSFFGASVASAGDLNGDGYGDVVVGAFGTGPVPGSAYVFVGGASGLATSATAVLHGNLDPGGQFGISVANAGDANGDGYADLVVGARFGGPTSGGTAYVYLGSSAVASLAVATTFVGPDGADGDFGVSVAGAGDVDGDGYADVIVGAGAAVSGDETGAAYVYRGGTLPLATTFATHLTGRDGAGGDFGTSVSGTGDVNGDGFTDVIVGAPNESPSVPGAAYLYPGQSSGLGTTPATSFTGPDGPDANFGGSVARRDAPARTDARA